MKVIFSQLAKKELDDAAEYLEIEFKVWATTSDARSKMRCFESVDIRGFRPWSEEESGSA